jgi:hypothetical protein
MNFDTMNEADVREIIVRPLLHRLGYQHGTEANIRTEVTLRYGKTFLGRKQPNKDPDLVGRADYICEVISFGRWTVEVKAPSQALDREAAEQAHSYSAHPDVAASYFLLTNGREFRLYRTGVLDQPALAWGFEAFEQNILPLFNVVGPDAIRKLSNLTAVDAGKPLGRGLPSVVRLIGGVITYEDHASDTPLVPNEAIDGLRLPVTGGTVRRADDGRIHAHVQVAKSAPLFGDYAETMGIADTYDFYSADEYISNDPATPTIFQNLYESRTPAGKIVTVPVMGSVPLPFGFTLTAFTEAVGFMDGDMFRGTMRLDYDLRIEGMPAQVRSLLEAQMGRIPDRSQFSGAGSFEVSMG